MQKLFAFAILLCSGLSVTTLSAQTDKLISIGYYLWDLGSGVVKRGDSSSISYNAQLLVDSRYEFDLDTSTGIWEPFFRRINYSYDANGNLLGYVAQHSDDLGGWKNSNRYSFVYNANNQELIQKVESWNGSNWVQIILNEKVYDANGLLISSTNSGNRLQFFYTSAGLLAKSISQLKIGGNWVNTFQRTFEYYPNSNLLEVEKLYDWVSGSWSAEDQKTYQYDSQGNEIEMLYVNFNFDQLTKESSEYDAENNLVFRLSSNWDGANWLDKIRRFYTYDSNNNLMSERIESFHNAEWKLLSYERFHYATLSGISQMEWANFDVFPNPATSSVTLQGEHLESAQIIDRQGRVVSQLTLNQQGATHIPVAQLTPGLYFIQAMDHKGDSGVKPLMIQR